MLTTETTADLTLTRGYATKAPEPPGRVVRMCAVWKEADVPGGAGKPAAGPEAECTQELSAPAGPPVSRSLCKEGV